MTLFYRVVRGVAALFVRLFFRVRFDGLENIPDHGTSGGYMLCANHRTIIDPFFLAAAFRKKQLYTVVKAELMANWFTRWFFKNMGSHAVNRGAGDMSAIEYAKKCIEEDKILLIYPEGTRSKTGELLRPKSGVGLIAADTKANVLPAAIYYEGLKLSPFKKVTVRFGEIIKNEEFEFSTPLRSTERKQSVKTIMERIAFLLGEKHGRK